MSTGTNSVEEDFEEYEEEEELSHEEDFDDAFEDAVDELRGDSGEDEEEKPAPKDSKDEGEKAPGTKEKEEADEFQVDKYLEAKNLPEEEAIPQGWAAGDAKLTEVWKTLPQEVKAQIQKREADRVRFMHQETGKLQESYKKVAPVAQLLNELNPIAADKWALEDKPLGMAEGIRQSVAVREYIKNTPNLELAKQFLKAAGGTPQDLEDSPQAAQSSEIQQLREELKALKNSNQEPEVSPQDAQRQQLSAQVAQRYYAFAETLNAFGEPKYPSARLPGFADAMGSLIARRVQEVPHASIDEHIKAVYASMGGEIQSGNVVKSSNTEQLRAAATSGYAKGNGTPAAPQSFDKYDDAWDATLSEYGLLDE